VGTGGTAGIGKDVGREPEMLCRSRRIFCEICSQQLAESVELLRIDGASFEIGLEIESDTMQNEAKSGEKKTRTGPSELEMMTAEFDE